MAHDFSIQYYRVTYCDHPGCRNRPSAEVRLFDAHPGVGHEQVCQTHIGWAKAEQVRKHKVLTTADRRSDNYVGPEDGRPTLPVCRECDQSIHLDERMASNDDGDWHADCANAPATGG